MAYGKEFDFHNHPIESLLFFDVETVRKVEEVTEGTPLYEAFVYKMRYSEEAQRKDFNEYNVKALYADKAALYPEFGKIVCITVGKIVEGNKIALHTFNDADEKVILVKFNAFLLDRVTKDPKLVMCGLNIKFFDLRYIYIRSVVHQVKPVKGHIDLTGLKPWEVKTCDITDIWKQTSSYNAPMPAIAECLGLPSPKLDIDGSQTSDVYYKEGEVGVQRISRYCERDVFTTANIVMRLRFLPLLELADATTAKKVKGGVADGELPPLLTRLYNLNMFDDVMEKELKKIIGRKRLTKTDKENLKTILVGVYTRTDFVNADQDSKSVKEQKLEEINNFIETL